MHKAVFLDRDGTIIKDVGYLNNLQEIEFLPGSIEAVKKLNQAGYKVVVITNQSGVARGLIREDIIQAIDKTLQRKILSSGGHLDAIYYCPHHPEHGYYPYKQDCGCRKPKPGMIKQAAKDLDIDLSQSYMIGDKVSDIEAGKNAGVKTLLVLTGKGSKQQAKLLRQPEHVADNLVKAVDWLLNTL